MNDHDRTVIALCFIITWFLMAVMMGGLIKLERLIAAIGALVNVPH